VVPRIDVSDFGYQADVSEAMRMAFADAHAFVADPQFSNVPVETMLSKVSACKHVLISALSARASEAVQSRVSYRAV
jgi:gamma-glutamyltranspeptidase